MNRRLSYIFLRKVHFLPLACQLIGHYRDFGDDVVMVARRNLWSYLDDYGFSKAIKIINHQQLGVGLAAGDREANIVLPHTSTSIDEWAAVQRRLTLEGNYTFSFFADGYTNVLVAPGAIKNFMDANKGRHGGDILFFDYPGDLLRYQTSRFARQVVSPFNLKVMASIPHMLDLANRAARALKEIANGRPILLILLRPWGSQTYYRDRYSFTAAAQKVSGVIDALVTQFVTDFSCQPVVVVRPDSRDPALMAEIMEHQRAKSMVVDFSKFWPDNLNMDPFIYNLNHQINENSVAIASLDSTATLPFVGLGRQFTYYIGAPENSVKPLFSDEGASSGLIWKISLLERHLSALSKRIPCDVTRIDQYFVTARLR